MIHIPAEITIHEDYGYSITKKLFGPSYMNTSYVMQKKLDEMMMMNAPPLTFSMRHAAVLDVNHTETLKAIDNIKPKITIE